MEVLSPAFSNFAFSTTFAKAGTVDCAKVETRDEQQPRRLLPLEVSLEVSLEVKTAITVKSASPRVTVSS